MIIYNVTVKIEKSIEPDWLQWMSEVHVPDVMKTGLFLDSAIRRLLYLDDDDGITFSIQYRLKNEEDLKAYQANHATALQADHTERYKGKYVAFRTLMIEEAIF